MDLQKLRVRKDLERMVINYFLRGEISEDQSAHICDFIDNAIGGGNYPQPCRHNNGRAVISFPTSYAGPKPVQQPNKKPEQEEPEEESLEIYAPYGEALPEGIEDFREVLQRDGLVLISYKKLKGSEGTFFDILWAQSFTRCRNTNWSGAVREEEIPYAMPLDYDNAYAYRSFRDELETVYTVNVAPEKALSGKINDFLEYVQSLKDMGMKNNFDYQFIFAAEKRNRFLSRNKELVDLKLSARVITCLDDREIHTRRDLERLTIKEIRKMKGLGPVMINETIATLKKAGIILQETQETMYEEAAK